MGEAFDLLCHPIASEGFQGHDNPGMEHSPTHQQEAAVGDLMGEGMFEGVRVLGKEARLVQQPATWRCVRLRYRASSGSSAMAWSRGKDTSVPITAAVWSRRFSLGGSRSMRAASTACTVAGTCRACSGCARRYAPGSPPKRPVSTRVRTLSSRKKDCLPCAPSAAG